MSFEAVVTISAITEVIVISAISLTLINAFSHGALARFVFGQKQRPVAKVPAAEAVQDEELQYRRAA